MMKAFLTQFFNLTMLIIIMMLASVLLTGTITTSYTIMETII